MDYRWDIMVTLTVPKGLNGWQDRGLVIINGKSYTFPVGIETEVPQPVAHYIDMIAKKEEQEDSFSPPDLSFVDPTLPVAGMAADAKATGDGIAAISKGLAINPADYNVAVLTLDGDCTGMTKDDYVPLAFTFQGRSGTVQVKKQGTSSIQTGIDIGAGFDDDLGGLFNFTLKFPEAFESKEGWGAHDKYCFKANAIDHSHLRNVGGATLWGQIVASRDNMQSAIWPNAGTYGDRYSYSGGVFTAKSNANVQSVKCCINGFTLPTGNYRFEADVLVPSGGESAAYSVYITDANNVSVGKSFGSTADEWSHIGISSGFNFTGNNGYVSIQAKDVDGMQFKNVLFKNLDTNEIHYLDNPMWQLAQAPNYGAVDGIPCAIVLNGKYYMTGTLNIPKAGWMAVMGYGNREAILCAEGTDNCYMTGTAAVGTDYELEYVSDEDNASWVQTSLDNLIAAVVNSDGTDLDTTIAQYLDWDSAIDMLIFISLIGGFDLKKKNYLMYTYDGVKWIMGAYDMDSIWGNWWDGLSFVSATKDNMTSVEDLKSHRLYYLILSRKLAAFKARYAELRAGVLSEGNVEMTLNNLAAGMPLALLNENTKRWPKLRSTAVNNLAQILNWYRLRCAAIDKEVEKLN